MIVGTAALLAIVTGAPGYARLLDAILADPDPLLPAPCLLDAHLALRRGWPPAMLATLDAVLADARLRIVPFGAEEAALARAAAGRRGATAPGLGDCVASAVAQARGRPLL